MNFRVISVLLLLAPCAFAQDARPYINNKKAPENRKDLEAINKALTDALPRTRLATVCIEMKEGSGTGVIVSPEGLVLTAAHVATGVKKKVTVILEDGTKLDALTLGLNSDKDAAMLQITAKGNYPCVEFDRSNSTKLGDWVFALGHAGGFDKARGSVVRLGRLVRIADGTFQSDCMLIGGDSGGPLFDLNGKLIAIHSRVGRQAQVNMHVPVQEFLDDWDTLQSGEFSGEGPYASRPIKGSGFLGLATEARPPKGLRVTKVGKDSPAQVAGIKENDLLLKINGIDLESRDQMKSLILEMAAGDELDLEVERGGSVKIYSIELGEI